MEEKLCPGCKEPIIERVPKCPLQCVSTQTQCKAYQQKSKFDPTTKPIVWVLGGPGSGKYTQCKKIVKDYGFTHLSTGDLLRDEVAMGSKRAKCLNSIMTRGGLIPNDLILFILREAMEKAADEGSAGYLLDGYPREKHQGVEFEHVVGPVSLILYFEASIETMCQRLMQRAVTSFRKDDKPEIMRRRMQVFVKNDQSILDLYRDRVVKINAEQPVEAIFAEVRRAIDPIVARAAVAEAEIAEAEALEKAKAVSAYARSSICIVRSSIIMGKSPDPSHQALIAQANLEAAAAQAAAEAARRAVEAARALVAEKYGETGETVQTGQTDQTNK